MKVEFNSNGFTAEMDSPTSPDNNSRHEKAASYNVPKPLVLGIASLVLALGNLPFGFFMNMSFELISEHVTAGVPTWLWTLLVFSGIFLLISAVCALFAIAAFFKSEKGVVRGLGVSLAIIAVLVICLCIYLNANGIIAWNTMQI